MNERASLCRVNVDLDLDALLDPPAETRARIELPQWSRHDHGMITA